MTQSKEDIAIRSFGQARQCLKNASNLTNELLQHEGGYTPAYKSTMNSKIKNEVKLAQQLIHYGIENSTGMSNVSTNPSKTKLEELGVLDKE